EVGVLVGPECDGEIGQEPRPGLAGLGFDVVDAVSRRAREPSEDVLAIMADEVLDEQPCGAAQLERARRVLADESDVADPGEVAVRAAEVRIAEVGGSAELTALEEDPADDVLGSVRDASGQPEHVERALLSEMDHVLELVGEDTGHGALDDSAGPRVAELPLRIRNHAVEDLRPVRVPAAVRIDEVAAVEVAGDEAL